MFTQSNLDDDGCVTPEDFDILWQKKYIRTNEIILFIYIVRLIIFKFFYFLIKLNLFYFYFYIKFYFIYIIKFLIRFNEKHDIEII